MGSKEKKSATGKRRLSDSEKKQIVRAFKAHKGPKEAFFQAQGITGSAVYRWIKEAAEKKASKAQGLDGQPKAKGKGSNAPEKRKEAVEAYLKSGATYGEFAKIWGVSSKSLSKWHKVYEERGAPALESGIYGTGKRGRKGSSPHLKAQIVSAQKEHPDFGLKKVRDFLFRFRGVKVSTGTVRKTVKEAKLPRAPLRPKKRRRSADKVRRFERAKPMQLWQSDITSFVLTRHSQRVYLTVYIDDHSRYIVAWSLMLRQKSDLVMDSLLMGIQRFGKPEEVLTDQGRQYFSWRGKSDFQKLLDREGIRHVVARSHHPQTLGKCERFWETVGQEFWERVKPQELEDTRERFGHFIAHYNHFRPHQGIDGMTPADRFFGVATEVRRVIEATLTQNELRLAVGDAPRSPVFLIGQIGDQPVSLHGESGSLVIQTPNGVVQHLEYSQFGHSAAQPAQVPAQLISPPQTAPIPKGTSENVELPESSSRTDGLPAELGRAPAEAEHAQTTATSQAASEDAEPAACSHEVAVGVGNGCPEGAGPPDSGVPDGVLAGPGDQARDRASPEVTAAASMAALPASDLGYGSRTAQSTENPWLAERADPGSPERSEAAPKEDPATRDAGAEPGAADLLAARTPGSPLRADAETHDSDRGASPRALRTELTQECKTSQEGQIASPKQGSVDDDTEGKSS